MIGVGFEAVEKVAKNNENVLLVWRLRSRSMTFNGASSKAFLLTVPNLILQVLD